MKIIPTTLLALSVLTAQGLAQTPDKVKPADATQKKPARALGYKDTPIQPNGKWHVHDGERPQPRVVTPGTVGTAKRSGTAPSDAIVLFDGKDLSKWTGRNDKASWKVENGFMEVNRTGEIRTRESFGSCQLHVEWASPHTVKGNGQGRGNSGIFVMGGYEIQVLDNYDNQTYPDGQAGSLYGQKPPLVNVCKKPGEWQTFDILFTAPRFDGKKLITPAYVTRIHNGVVVQNHSALLGPTRHKRLTSYKAHGEAPIKLQDHGNPVRYRNIWLRRLD